MVVDLSFFMVKNIKRLTQQLRMIFLLHFGQSTFRIHYGRSRKHIMFMIFGFWDVSMTPKTKYVYLRRHQDTPHNLTKSPNHFYKLLYLEIAKCWKYKSLSSLKKTRPDIPEDPSNILESLNMGSISSRKHEMHMSVLWDQSFPKSLIVSYILKL